MQFRMNGVNFFNRYLVLMVAFVIIGCDNQSPSSNMNIQSSQVTSGKLENHVKDLKKFVSSKIRYNQDTAFLIDMKVMSGKKRFFVYDLKKNRILESGLVAHGSGSETGKEGELKFSNVENSYCTSLGKYYVGASYHGQYGKAYKLHGLDKTNDNAFNRNIVLHKFASMPYEEQDSPIVNSLGCPMVNEKFYKILEKYIDNSSTKIILEIYY